jgi:hypothetical protein
MTKQNNKPRTIYQIVREESYAYQETLNDVFTSRRDARELLESRVEEGEEMHEVSVRVKYKIVPLKTRTKQPFPQRGQWMYVPDFIESKNFDFCGFIYNDDNRSQTGIEGGLARVSSVSRDSENKRHIWVAFNEINASFLYNQLLRAQAKLKQEFGKRKAKPVIDKEKEKARKELEAYKAWSDRLEDEVGGEWK